MGLYMFNERCYTGCGGSLAQLSDVNITNPQDGQVPVYNATLQEWENQFIQSGGASYRFFVKIDTIGTVQSVQLYETGDIIELEECDEGDYPSESTVSDVFFVDINSPLNNFCFDTTGYKLNIVIDYDGTEVETELEIPFVVITSQYLEVGVSDESQTLGISYLKQFYEDTADKDNFNAINAKGAFDAIDKRIVPIHYADLMELIENDEDDPDVNYLVDDAELACAPVDDDSISDHSVWSSEKVSNTEKVTRFTVTVHDWVEDTTSQSGTTLYKKQIPLNNVHVDCPTVSLGQPLTVPLPTVANQEAYNLLQYVIVENEAPCYLMLYSSAVPKNAYYISVTGVD